MLRILRNYPVSRFSRKLCTTNKNENFNNLSNLQELSTLKSINRNLETLNENMTYIIVSLNFTQLVIAFYVMKHTL